MVENKNTSTTIEGNRDVTVAFVRKAHLCCKGSIEAIMYSYM
jgi:hypothetical protein